MQKIWYVLAVAICSILTVLGILFAGVFILSVPEILMGISDDGFSKTLDTMILSLGVMALSWWQYRYRHIVYPQFKRDTGAIRKDA